MTRTGNGRFVQRNNRIKNNKQRSRCVHVSVDNILKMSFLGLLCLYLYIFFTIAYSMHSESSGSGSGRINTRIDVVAEAGATRAEVAAHDNITKEIEGEDNFLPRVLALVFP